MPPPLKLYGGNKFEISSNLALEQSFGYVYVYMEGGSKKTTSILVMTILMYLHYQLCQIQKFGNYGYYPDLSGS